MKDNGRTRSLCPKCLSVVPAWIEDAAGGVTMRKQCPQHGAQEVLISSDSEWYRRVMDQAAAAVPPASAATGPERGCPLDCGLCATHTQRVRLPVVPITSACNLDCPVCYTINKNTDAYFMPRDEFAAIIDQIRDDSPDLPIINFTGGEPLVHPRLCEFVEMCRDAGIQRITISTNGLQFLEDDSLLPRLTELGARIVLSFNSFGTEPYRVTAGRDLLDKKLAVLSQLEKLRPSTTLLTVVAAGVNDDEIGEIVRYVLRSDFVLSAEIHTVTFTGQNVARFDRQARLTTPDVLKRISERNPELTMEDFLPSPCAHPLCYATSYLLRLGSGRLVPFGRFVARKPLLEMLAGSLYMEPTQGTEEVLVDALNDLWSKRDRTPEDDEFLDGLKGLLRRLFPPQGLALAARQRVAEQATKAIYVHSHMDADTFDLARIRRCCVAVPDGQGHNVPTCAYNTLYRARDRRFTLGV